MLKIALAKLLTLKVAAAAVAATAAGGVALAATGTLPNPLADPGNAGGAAVSDMASSRGGQGVNKSDASPTPSLHGLCQAYVSDATDNPGKALDSPAFQALVRAAGGDEKVDTFCDDLLKDTPSQGPPAGTPGGPPADLPTGPPTSRPSGPPVVHPTGPPTAVPAPPG
jgi:hypothetical protein